MKRLVFVYALGLTFGLAFQAPAAEPARPVVSILVDQQASLLQSYTGVVVARTETALGFPIIGTVAARPAGTGDIVTKGDVLAQLSTEDFDADLRTAEAGVTVARAQLRSATDARDRAKELSERGVGSATRLEDSERALVSAQARLEQALASRARAADIRDLATLSAPFDGVVTETLAEAGATLSAGQAILRLAAIGEREIIIDVSEDSAVVRAIGDRFTARLLANDGVTAAAVLARIDPVAERATRTHRLHLTLESAPPAFRLGALVKVTPAGSGHQDIFVPLSALLDPRAVWVVDRSDDTIALRQVELGATSGGFAIVSSGLTAGDEVVIKGIHSLKEGQVVGPRETE
ncbi:efflux RND transporter periplasmic adaptor subunit [Hoeflea sp. G2-23]|uniref:Efflux RND transporter periplasmic adaptor subunit n=1 Tax=Hoeflea algicola TaxID=2983763 RepID=A0ABT3Z9P2_9HYPH|nr:efflux RND transporter periplasmic adaptor subunit [Hoeflea algicola]MCY0148439.1 efflux RND transporter periplasmic adaptor subunit [Hoeflea algicola]